MALSRYILISIAFSLLIAFSLVLLLFRFAPGTLISLVDNYTAPKITVESVRTQLWPVVIKVDRLSLEVDDINLIKVEEASLQTSILKLLSNHPRWWTLNARGGALNFSALSVESESPPTDSKLFSVFSFLEKIHGNIEQFGLQLDEETNIIIDSLAMNIDSSPSEARFRAEFSSNGEDIVAPTELTIYSKSRGDYDYLEIRSKSLGFGDLIPHDTPEQSGTEAALDWSWLSRLKNTELHIFIDEVRFPDFEIQDLIAELDLSRSIKIKKIEAMLSADYLQRDAVTIKGEVRPLGSVTSGADAEVDLSLSSSNIEASMTGLQNLNGNRGTRSDWSIAISQWPFTLVDSYVNPRLPITLSTTLRGQQDEFSLSDLLVSDRLTTASGEIKVGNVSQARKLITGSLKLDNFVYSSNEFVDQGSVVVKSAEATTIFSKEVFEFPSLVVDAKIELDLQSLMIGKTQVEDISLILDSTENIHRLSDLSAQLGGGSIEGDVVFKQAKDSPTEFSARIVVDKVSLEQTNFFSDYQLEGGVFNSSATLKSAGNSAAELAGALSGEIVADLGRASLKKGSLELIGQDLLLELSNRLNPFNQTDDKTNIECAVANSRIEQGKIRFSNSLVLETDKMAIIANGNIDLAGETVEFRLSPKAQQGLGINTATLAKFLNIGGPLKNPKLDVNAAGVMKTGAALGAAISTGGATLIADGLINRAAKGKTCSRALKAYSNK